MVFVRPEAFENAQSDSANSVRGEVLQTEFEGNLWQLHVQLPNGGPRITRSSINDGRATKHQVGDNIELGFSETAAIALPTGLLAAE